MDKVLNIESQILDGTYNEAILMCSLLEVAKEAGYTIVHDHWGHNAHDESTIDEAIARFTSARKLMLDNENGGIALPLTDSDDELPF